MASDKSATAYLVFDYRIDMPSLLRDGAEFEPGVGNGLFEAVVVQKV
jgi:hypothetical protein